jgi:hypothetical protein
MFEIGREKGRQIPLILKTNGMFVTQTGRAVANLLIDRQYAAASQGRLDLSEQKPQLRLCEMVKRSIKTDHVVSVLRKFVFYSVQSKVANAGVAVILLGMLNGFLVDVRTVNGSAG